MSGMTRSMSRSLWRFPGHGVSGGIRDLLAFFAANNITPKLGADFQQASGSELYRSLGTTRTFAEMFPNFARASSATYVDSNGILQTAAVDEPRRNHHVWDGSAWVNRGLRYETEQRTNLLLNSGTLSTQNVTVTNEPHTIHFTGTGEITLSGTATGTLTGTGTGEGNRVSLTFTPTAGTLTVTVSGTVTNGQLEVGSTPSSYIPTSGATVTRAAESGLTIPSALLPWNANGVSIAVEGLMTYADEDVVNQVKFLNWSLASNNYIDASINTSSSLTGRPEFRQRETNSGTRLVVGFSSAYSPGTNVPFSAASRHSSALNGAADGTATTETTATLPDLSATDFQLTPVYMGTIGKLLIWDADIQDAGIVEASS